MTRRRVRVEDAALEAVVHHQELIVFKRNVFLIIRFCYIFFLLFQWTSRTLPVTQAGNLIDSMDFQKGPGRPNHLLNPFLFKHQIAVCLYMNNDSNDRN